MGFCLFFGAYAVMAMTPGESGHFISKSAKNVKISNDKVTELSEKLAKSYEDVVGVRAPVFNNSESSLSVGLHLFLESQKGFRRLAIVNCYSLSHFCDSKKKCSPTDSELSELLTIFKELVAGKVSLGGFSDHPCHPVADEAALNWIFLVDTLNFCFWSREGAHWEVKWRGETYTGYFALCAAINRAIEEGVNVTDPRVYCEWSLADVERILRGDNGVQPMLLSERLQCARQVGRTLIDKYQGNFANCVKESQGSAQRLLRLIVTEFPCFRDEADYNGERVSFYKRAQILIGDVWSCFEGKGLGAFDDINTLTMFADYRVPQVLVYFGVLEYSKDLYNKLTVGDMLPNGSVEEVEIRGCSIEAVERLKTRVDQLTTAARKELLCNSILIDHFLWNYRRTYRTELDKIPFHKTICIYY